MEESSPKDARRARQLRMGEAGQAWGVEDAGEHVPSGDAAVQERGLQTARLFLIFRKKLDIQNFMWNFPNLKTPCWLNKTRPWVQHSPGLAIVTRLGSLGVGGKLLARGPGSTGPGRAHASHATSPGPAQPAQGLGPRPLGPAPLFILQGSSLTPLSPARRSPAPPRALMPPPCYLWFCCCFSYLSARLVSGTGPGTARQPTIGVG